MQKDSTETQPPATPAHQRQTPLTHATVRELALACGADDAGLVSLDHPDLAEEREHARQALPRAQSLIAVVMRMHPPNIRSPQRSVANLEFHRTGHEVDEVARRIAVELTRLGHNTINPAMAFPMEMAKFPGRTWVISHKRVAVAAGLGQMGLHRSVIHPRFGSFILLGTVVTTASCDERDGHTESTPNPCISCKLCVAACPVGAIEPDGAFRFSACYDHNYRDFMTGFTDFVEQVVESKDKHEFRDRVPLHEAVTTWQSLAYKPSYNAAYCIAVCPAGDDVLGALGMEGAYREHARAFKAEVMKPLVDKEETLFVVKGSDAETHARQRFPHKRLRVVTSSLRATDPRAFFRAMPLIFQRGPARGWRATFQFDLTGERAIQATVKIDDGTLSVLDGYVGEADVFVRTDGALWLDIVNRRRSPVWLVLTRRLEITGDRALLDRFAACFPR